MGRDKLVGDGSAAAGCSLALTVGHAVGQDQIMKQELGDHSQKTRGQQERDSSPRP